MKVETRIVQVSKEIYIASDGKEFHDKNKCISHEIALLERAVELYTCDLVRTDLHGSTFLNIKNPLDVKNFKALCNYCGMSGKGVDDAPGVYMWRSNQWINISNIVETIERISKGAEK